MNIIYNTGLGSLAIQIITGAVGLYAVLLNHDPSMFLVRDLLWMELFVQLIEGIFYVWMIATLANFPNLTMYRYYDWVITTPTMLLSYCMYLVHVRNGEEKKKETLETNDYSFQKLVNENLHVLVPIFALNTLMLFFGFLAEIGKISFETGAVLGFIPFFAFFYLIYDNYAKYTLIGRSTFWYFSGIWGLYGFASLLSYKLKNASYNILDVFSKNFFGIFLAVVLYINTSS